MAEGVLEQHRRRLADEPDYREAALTAPSPTDKTGISAKYLERTAPTVGKDAAESFDVEEANKAELIDYAERHDIPVKKSDKVEDIRDTVRAAL